MDGPEEDDGVTEAAHGGPTGHGASTHDGGSPDLQGRARSGPTTVEELVRTQVAQAVGGPRGAVEVGLPIVAFTLAYVFTDEVRLSALIGVGAGLAMLAVRLVQGTPSRFVYNGLFGIAVAAIFASVTGRAESAFLPGILQSAAWAAGLGLSIVLRAPAVGFLIGALMGDTTGWRKNPAIVRLSNRLTFVMMVPMVVRVAIQYPLYLAGEVGWLGVSRIALGWPLSLLAFTVAAAILARGRTPL